MSLKIANARYDRAARGVTLLEILIVLTIMLMVTGATIPLIAPALQNRRMQEASRLVSSFISGARSRAIETGKPVGVVFERSNGLPFCSQLSYVEVPPRYSGDTLDSKVLVDNTTGRVTGMSPSTAIQPNLVRYGDLIQFDFKGPIYVIASRMTTPDDKAGQVAPPPASGTPWILRDAATGATPVNIPNYAAGISFQIIRQPVRSSATPLQLPDGTVVDLLNSGMKVDQTFQPPSTTPPIPYDPTIVFAPQGSVRYVSWWIPDPMMPSNIIYKLMPPTGPLFFLVGKRELMPDLTMSQFDENVGPDPMAIPGTSSAYRDSFWVTVANQTGQANINENATNLGPRNDPMNYLPNARTFANSGQGKGR